MKPKLKLSVKSDPNIKAAARSTAELLLITAAAKAAVSKCLEATKVPRAPLPPMPGLTRFLITGDATFGLKMNAQMLFALGEGLEKFIGGTQKKLSEQFPKEKATEESPIQKAVPEESVEEMVEEVVAEEPIEETVEEVVAEEPVEETVEEVVPEEPVEETVEEVVAEEPVEETVEEVVAEEPDEETVEEVVAEEPVEETVEEVVAEEPVKETVEEVVAEEPVEETVEEVAEEPVEETVEEPAVETMAAAAAVAEAVEETADAAEDGETPEFAEGGNLEYIDVKDEPEVYAALLAEAKAGKIRLVTRYRQSYESRLVLSKDPIQDYYNGIKNELFSYKGVKSRISWANETFRQGRNHIAKIIVKTSSLYIYLALDPEQLAGTKYESAVTVLSGRKKFETVPVLLKIKGERKYKYALEMIAMVCGEKLGLPKNKKFMETDYKRPVQSLDEMVETGLVRKLVAAAPLEETAE